MRIFLSNRIRLIRSIDFWIFLNIDLTQIYFFIYINLNRESNSILEIFYLITVIFKIIYKNNIFLKKIYQTTAKKKSLYDGATLGAIWSYVKV